jgi:hypothetical protein
MRSNIIISSIANVITRFSVKATTMLRASHDALAGLWRLDPCAGPLSGRHSGTNLLFRNMSMVSREINGNNLPAFSQPSQKQPGNVVRNQQLFQRLS